MRIGGDRRTPFAHRFAIARKSARRSADFANRARLRAECRLAQGASADRCEYAERVKDSVLKSSRAALDRGLFIGLSIELLRCKTTDAGGCGPVDSLITLSATRSFSILQSSEHDVVHGRETGKSRAASGKKISARCRRTF